MKKDPTIADICVKLCVINVLVRATVMLDSTGGFLLPLRTKISKKRVRPHDLSLHIGGTLLWQRGALVWSTAVWCSGKGSSNGDYIGSYGFSICIACSFYVHINTEPYIK